MNLSLNPEDDRLKWKKEEEDDFSNNQEMVYTNQKQV